jgi:hypothetical protein
MKEHPASPSVPPEWIEKNYLFTVNFGRIRFGTVRLRTKQFWTPFPDCINHRNLPAVNRHDLDGVNAVRIAGFPVSKAFPLVQFPPGVIQYMQWSDTRFLVAIKGTFDAYVQSRSRTTRKRLNQQIRRWRALSGGATSIKEFRIPAEMADFYSIAGPLSRKSWQGKKGVGLEEIDTREDILRMAAAGQARGYILYCGNQPAAFQLYYVQGTTMVASQIGYDPAYAELSPGTTLLYLILEKLFAEGEMEYLDLIEGTGWAYKSSFATLRVPSMQFIYFPRRPVSLCFVLLLYSMNKLQTSAGQAKRMVRRSIGWMMKKPFLADSHSGGTMAKIDHVAENETV